MIHLRIRAAILACCAALIVSIAGGAATPREPHPVKTLKVTLLSTMLADAPKTHDQVGEWGFAALLESDGHKILIDTGAQPETVRMNARSLHVDLCEVQDVVLTHHHSDHTTGLMTLRRDCMAKHPQALSRVHVATGIFWLRRAAATGLAASGQRDASEQGERNPMIAIRKEFEATGGLFIEHNEPIELYPGIWLTGPIERKFPEENYGKGLVVISSHGTIPDNVPEDQSVVVEREHGLIVITGCGHAGIVNIVTRSNTIIPGQRLYAVIGGLHLFDATDLTLDWTADRLKGFGLEYLVGAHCTGIEAVYRLRNRIGLDRKTAVVGAVGATFVLGEGIHPGAIAQ